MKTLKIVAIVAAIVVSIVLVIWRIIDGSLEANEREELANEINPRLDIKSDTIFYKDSVYVVSKNVDYAISFKNWMDIKRGKYTAVSKKPLLDSFLFDSVKIRGIKKDGTWNKWYTSYDKKDKIFLDKDQTWIKVLFETAEMNLKVLNISELKEGIKWDCWDTHDNKYVSVTWDYSVLNHSVVIVLAGSLQMMNYIKQ